MFFVCVKKTKKLKGASPILRELGWNEYWQSQFEQYADKNLLPARVTAVYTQNYELGTEHGTKKGQLTGKMHYESLYSAQRPAVGDWVAVIKNPDGPYAMQAVLPRETCLQREEVKGVGAQVVAANVQVCLVMQALSGDFNKARLDRYLAMVWEGGALPAIVLTKADLEEIDEIRKQVAALRADYPETEIFVVSAVTREGMDEFYAFLEPHKTYAATGSSGVGKSTLLNLLAGQKFMATGVTRGDGKRGRHTTTHKQLFKLPNGALFIDTPGMRELALFQHNGIDHAFKDIKRIAVGCKFRNCQHQSEPGCAVRRAIEAGELDQKRWQNYLKLKQEESYLKEKQILLNKKVAKAKQKRSKVHYKDFVRGGYEKPRQ